MEIQQNLHYQKLLSLLNKTHYSQTTTSDDLIEAKLIAESLAEDPDVQLPIIINGKKSNILIARKTADSTNNEKGNKGNIDVIFNLTLAEKHNPSTNCSCDTIKQDGQKLFIQPENNADFSNLERSEIIIKLLKAAIDKSHSKQEQPTKDSVRPISPIQDTHLSK